MRSCMSFGCAKQSLFSLEDISSNRQQLEETIAGINFADLGFDIEPNYDDYDKAEPESHVHVSKLSDRWYVRAGCVDGFVRTLSDDETFSSYPMVNFGELSLLITPASQTGTSLCNLLTQTGTWVILEA